MIKKKKNISKPRVYFDGNRVVKDFGNRVSDAKKALSRLNAFRKNAGTVKIHGYSVVAASAEIARDKPGCLVMPRYDGVVLSELGDDDIKTGITIVSAWYAHQLNRTEGQGPGFIHGDPHMQNIIMDKKKKHIVLIDAFCREATPKNIWLDVLLLAMSISLHLGASRTIDMQQVLYNDIITGNHALKSRKLLIRQSLVLSKHFFLADKRVHEKARVLAALFTCVVNFMRMLWSSPRKSSRMDWESAV
jgi:hypothetical protein